MCSLRGVLCKGMGRACLRSFPVAVCLLFGGRGSCWLGPGCMLLGGVEVRSPPAHTLLSGSFHTAACMHMLMHMHPPPPLRTSQARRPENEGPAELYYNDKRAAQYTSNTRVMSIQSAMSTRALELLNFPSEEPRLILDCECQHGPWLRIACLPRVLPPCHARGGPGPVALMGLVCPPHTRTRTRSWFV